MTPKLNSLLEIALVSLPVLITLVGVIVGSRQVRSLRNLTGDKSFISTVFGLTIEPPSAPSEKELKVYPPLRLIPAFIRKRHSA